MGTTSEPGFCLQKSAAPADVRLVSAFSQTRFAPVLQSQTLPAMHRNDVLF
jgi:hypothetical protein